MQQRRSNHDSETFYQQLDDRYFPSPAADTNNKSRDLAFIATMATDYAESTDALNEHIRAAQQKAARPSFDFGAIHKKIGIFLALGLMHSSIGKLAHYAGSLSRDRNAIFYAKLKELIESGKGTDAAIHELVQTHLS